MVPTIAIWSDATGRPVEGFTTILPLSSVIGTSALYVPKGSPTIAYNVVPPLKPKMVARPPNSSGKLITLLLFFVKFQVNSQVKSLV